MSFEYERWDNTQFCGLHSLSLYGTFDSESKDGLTCVQCGKEAGVGYWNDGMSHYNQPCLLHDVDECVLLVSAVYVCTEQQNFST